MSGTVEDDRTHADNDETDDTENDNIVLYDDQNNRIELEQIAVVRREDRTYALLRPVSGIEGVGDNEGLVFGVEESDGEEYFVPISDDTVIDFVFSEYYRMLKETNGGNA